MNWGAIGAIGDVLGAAGVIASLIYLATQIRGEARARHAARIHEQVQALSNFHRSVATSPDLADIWFRGSYDFSSLKRAELPRFSSFGCDMFRTFEDNFVQSRSGDFDERIWRGHEAELDDIVAPRSTSVVADGLALVQPGVSGIHPEQA